MTDARTVNPGAPVTYVATERQPIAILRDAPQTASQRLTAVLDALLELGHGEVLLHGIPRAELVAWAGIHRLGVACDDDIATRTTRVLHRDGKTLCWAWESQA